jgi:hypothetical protein
LALDFHRFSSFGFSFTNLCVSNPNAQQRESRDRIQQQQATKHPARVALAG